MKSFYSKLCVIWEQLCYLQNKSGPPVEFETLRLRMKATFQENCSMSPLLRISRSHACSVTYFQTIGKPKFKISARLLWQRHTAFGLLSVGWHFAPSHSKQIRLYHNRQGDIEFTTLSSARSLYTSWACNTTLFCGIETFAEWSCWSSVVAVLFISFQKLSFLLSCSNQKRLMTQGDRSLTCLCKMNGTGAYEMDADLQSDTPHIKQIRSKSSF